MTFSYNPKQLCVKHKLEAPPDGCVPVAYIRVCSGSNKVCSYLQSKGAVTIT